MNEGLKALKRLIGNKVFISLGRIQGKKQFAIDINIIEKELKDYYALKKECNESKWYQEHRALEAIKSIEGFVDEEDFFYDDEEDKYYFFGYKISKEKFELLKEVLL